MCTIYGASVGLKHDIIAFNFYDTSMKQIYYTIMKHSLLSLLIIFISFFLHTSASYAVNDPRKLYQVFSPEVATMTRYGTFPVSYYTGQPDISIPLYTVKSGDYEIPISLKYDASGVRPNRQSGIVGQNWNMTGVGMITRQVRGIPDDAVTNINGISYDGFLKMARDGNNLSREQLLNISNYYIQDYQNGGMILNINGTREFAYEPDLFTVHLPNRTSFQFMIDNSGNIQVIGRRACSVNIDSVNIQMPQTDILRSKITIIDENGYEYVFGGDVSNLEITYSPQLIYGQNANSYHYVELNTYSGVINAWYISSIRSPYKETIANYTYLATPMNRNTATNTDAPYLQKNMYILCGRESVSINGYPDTHSVESKLLSITKLSIPLNITTTNHKITYNYEIPNVSFYGTDISSVLTNYDGISTSYVNTTFTGSYYRLSSINITDYNDTTNIHLNYNTITSTESQKTTQRYYLESALINGETFRFSYNGPWWLPIALTKRIDMQGYFNGTSTTLMPNLTNAPIDWNVNLNFAHRATNPNYVDYGVLKSITYPTGGSSSFEYEAHQYGTKVKRNNDGTLGEYFSSETNHVGGLRIHKISNSDGTVTEYMYTDNGISSGVFHDTGVYAYYFTYSSGYYTQYGVYVNSISQQVDLGENYIGYSVIDEFKKKTNTAESIHKQYKYTTILSNPDLINISGNNTSILTNSIDDATKFSAQMNQLLVYSSKCTERGLLIQENTFLGNNLIKQINNQYRHSQSLASQFIVGAKIVFNGYDFGAANSYATYLSDYDTIVSTTRTLAGSTWIEEKSITERGGMTASRPHNLVTKQTKITSKGDSSYTIFKRPLDYGTLTAYSGETAKGIYYLQQQNRVSPIIEEATFLEKTASGSTSTYLIESTITDYRHEYNSPTPKYIYKTKLTAPLPSSQYTMSNVSGNSFNYQSDIFSTHVSFDMYNPTGKLLQLTDQAGVSTSYIWGYRNQKLLAIVEGEKYTYFSNFWGGGQGAMIMNYRGEDRFPTSEYLQSVNNLRNQISVPITTYTHSPLFGVTSITSPTGLTTYYDYYPSGELKSEYRYGENGHKQILKAYDYKYQEVAQ